MPQVVIGLLGEMRAGKGSVIKLIKNFADHFKYSVCVVSSGGLLAQDLMRFKIPVDRNNLMARANTLVELYGKGTLASGMIKSIRASEADITIYDAVRWDTDLNVLLRLPVPAVLLYVTADFNIRLERARAAAEKGEQNISEALFQSWHETPTECEVKTLVPYAHWKIENNCTVHRLNAQTSEFFHELILPKLKPRNP